MQAGARCGGQAQERRQSWGEHYCSGVSIGVVAGSELGAGLGALWGHELGSVLDTNSGLSQDLQTQEPCLWPLLGAHGVGLPAPPRVFAHTRAPWGDKGTPRWRLAPSHCHPPWEPGGCFTRGKHMLVM